MSKEYETVEKRFIDQLQGVGWEYVEGDIGVPYLTHRHSFREVVLRPVLEQALYRINHDDAGDLWLDERRINQAIAALERVSIPGLLASNEAVHALLLKGIKVEGEPDKHRGLQQTLRYIDLDNPSNNTFTVINQFRVDTAWSGGNRDYIIPDIVCFVNGIPLVVVECKSPALDGDASPIATGISDLLYYSNQRDDLEDNMGVEQLFYTNLFMVSTSFDEARYGTITARHPHYIEWKDPIPLTRPELADELGIQPELISSQHTLVAGMLHPETLIDLLANFAVFKEESGHRIKVVARYQQYRAVQETIKRLLTGKTRPEDGKNDRRGGIIWHTQGSGKSLTMVFLVRKIRRIQALQSFKVVVVTDRNDLQKQLSETATLTGETIDIARNSAQLRDLLSVDAPGLVFAMIQKQRGDIDGLSAQDFRDTLLLNSSTDILVLVDEAHRSHTNALHAVMKAALPNCAMIGFTGTPIIMGQKKETATIFGSFIDIYTIEQAVKDEATVKIIYEGRTADGYVKDEEGLNRRFEQLFNLDGYTPQEIEAIRRKYSTKSNIFEAKALIAAKADDMLRHYVATVLKNDMKAIVVASSRRAAVRYQAALVEAHKRLLNELYNLPTDFVNLSGDALDAQDEVTQFLVRAHRLLPHIEQLEFATVISANQEKDGDRWREWSDKGRIDYYVGQFKKPFDHKEPGQRSGLAFLCVNSMLLTGFDAPVAQVLYLDRGIREHELLQAIARVNRKYLQKTSGLVVDYFGVARYLQEALEAYSPQDIQGALQDIDDELPILEGRYNDVMDIFRTRNINNIYQQEDLCIYVLRDTRLRAEFVLKLNLFLDTLDTVLPRPAALPYLADAKQLGKIRIRARNRYRDGSLNLAGIGYKILELIDEYLESRSINPIIPPVSLMDVEAFKESLIGIVSARDKALEMEHELRYHIRRKMPEDPVYYRKLSEQLEDILQHYRDNWEELAKALAQLTTHIQAGLTDNNYGLSPVEARFMRLLEDEIIPDGIQPDEEHLYQLQAMTHQMVAFISSDVQLVDFWRRKVEQDKLRLKVFQFLQDNLGDIEHLNLLELTDKLLQLARHNHDNFNAND